MLKIFSAGTVASMGGGLVWRGSLRKPPNPVVPFEDIAIGPQDFGKSIRNLSMPLADAPASAVRVHAVPPLPGNDLKGYFRKMDDFEDAHAGDVYLPRSRYPILVTTFKRLHRVQRLVGYGNFSVLGFDEMRKYARTYSHVGPFTKPELDFLDEQFNVDATEYGFLGKKVTASMTAVIPRTEAVKIRGTGNFLFKGESEHLYKRLVAAVGPQLTLTSGIRGIVKQMHLFLAKAVHTGGNLSCASRSLAPPGHSYHGVGDFDVGKAGFGLRNFTDGFAQTGVYKRLCDLDYVVMRYPKDNLLGVRFEPWHIEAC